MIDHVSVAVSDLKRAAAFYEAVLEPLGYGKIAARPASVPPALLAGSMFGLFFVLLDRTSDDAGLTPLVTARLASVALAVGAADRRARGR